MAPRVYGGGVVGRDAPCCPFVDVIRFKCARRCTLSFSFSPHLSLSHRYGLVVLCVCALCVSTVCRVEETYVNAQTPPSPLTPPYHRHHPTATTMVSAHNIISQPLFLCVIIIIAFLERPPHPKNLNATTVTLNYIFISLILLFTPSYSAQTTKYTMYYTMYTLIYRVILLLLSIKVFFCNYLYPYYNYLAFGINDKPSPSPFSI